MSESKVYKPFQFKEFVVAQDRCAMKVGTDGILLGSWADVSQAKNVLDIGTGTGLVALMLAQRNASAQIEAIEIDKVAAQQATENVEASPFASRLTVRQTSLQTFQPQHQYDVIVSNPPFFENSLKADSQQRNLARHTDSLSHEELCLFASEHLSDHGKLCMVLPHKAALTLIQQVERFGLSISSICEVSHSPSKQVRRILLELSKQNCSSPVMDKLAIRAQDGITYSEAYKKLTNKFHPFF
ncbi:methyltransferase [Limibacter armeniacum]|uniref:tRNA1(Val) (adenine(37)-N6)-methyltransferase n=1 Tax=Limibacter armeniacum TaxID=466084 RepID=UPI002FE6B73E